MLPRATENAVANHMQPECLYLDHNGLSNYVYAVVLLHTALLVNVCRLVEIDIRFSSDFWDSTCKAVFALASFHKSSVQFLNLRGVLTLVSCSIVVVNLQVYFPLLKKVLRECLTFVFFSPQLMFWSFIILKSWLIFGKFSKNDYYMGYEKKNNFW